MKQLKGFSGNSRRTDDSAAQSLMNEAQKKFGGMNEQQLVDKLMNTVAESKENGTYNSEQMLSFVNSISPYLSDEQRARLESIIGIIV